MSNETLEWLNKNVLIGYTERRGTAWHYRASDQGDEPNHYTGPIPTEDVRRRLFNWKPLEAEVTATAITDDGVLTTTDPTRKAIMRSDTGAVLGIFKQSYRPHEYDQWLIRNVESILDADVAIGSAGLLRGGAVAWVQVEMEDTLEVEGVEYRPFLTAATSLDGSLASTYQTGSQVVVCDNTLSVALGQDIEHRFKIRHSAHSLNRIGEVRDALRIVHQAGDAFAAEVEALVRQEVTEKQWRNFTLAYTNPDPNSKRSKALAATKIDQLDRLWHTDERVEPWRGTAWGVVAAVNTWLHHEAPVRGASRVERNMERAVMGGVDASDRQIMKALDKVLA